MRGRLPARGFRLFVLAYLRPRRLGWRLRRALLRRHQHNHVRSGCIPVAVVAAVSAIEPRESEPAEPEPRLPEIAAEAVERRKPRSGQAERRNGSKRRQPEVSEVCELACCWTAPRMNGHPLRECLRGKQTPEDDHSSNYPSHNHPPDPSLARLAKVCKSHAFSFIAMTPRCGARFGALRRASVAGADVG